MKTIKCNITPEDLVRLGGELMHAPTEFWKIGDRYFCFRTGDYYKTLGTPIYDGHLHEVENGIKVKKYASLSVLRKSLK